MARSAAVSDLACGFEARALYALLRRATGTVDLDAGRQVDGALSARKHQQVVHCDRPRLEPLFSRLPGLNGASHPLIPRNENEGGARARKNSTTRFDVALVRTPHVTDVCELY